MHGDGGGVLIGGLAAHYAAADTDIRSVYGDGDIDSKGYGLSATLTWYGPDGGYVDAQVRLSRYDSDLTSRTLGKLGDGLDGRGRAFSVEAGKRMPLGETLTLTPQFQVAYSSIDFDAFSDLTSAVVSDRRDDSLRTRLGLSVDRQEVLADTRRRHVYALANLTYEWRGGPSIDVSGTPIGLRDERLWGELGLGGSWGWDRERITLYSEVSAATSMASFGDSYSLRGVVGLRWGF
jgi:fibronectin-binding autotransporter adhesin